MNKKLLFVGGLFNGFFTLFHLFLGWQIQGLTSLPPAQQALMQELNIGSVLMIAFAAFASLFCANDLLTTKLGKTALVFIALFYASRAGAEIVLAPRFSLLIFSVCILIALVYLFVRVTTRTSTQPEIE